MLMSHLHLGTFLWPSQQAEVRHRTDARTARWHLGLTTLRRLCWRCCQRTRSAGRMHSPPSCLSGYSGFCPSCVESHCCFAAKQLLILSNVIKVTCAVPLSHASDERKKSNNLCRAEHLLASELAAQQCLSCHGMQQKAYIARLLG